MKKQKSSIKKYQLSIKEKTKILFQNYEFGMPIISSLKNTKFDTIDEFADRLVFYNERDKDQDFLFTVQIESELEQYVKKYLIKRKKFVYNYTTENENFLNSHIYQLLLQYIPYELTDVEKSIFLDAYINMVTDLRGNSISEQRRKRLEKRLNINQD